MLIKLVERLRPSAVVVALVLASLALVAIILGRPYANEIATGVIAALAAGLHTLVRDQDDEEEKP